LTDSGSTGLRHPGTAAVLDRWRLVGRHRPQPRIPHGFDRATRAPRGGTGPRNLWTTPLTAGGQAAGGVGRGSAAMNESTKAAELAELAEVSALQALRATKQLLDGLLDQRRRLMIDARDEGASWADIGATLDVSRHAAHELYHRHTKNPWTATRVRKP